jgi:(p)ppGpp synthase/HD superfamily hydrolase
MTTAIDRVEELLKIPLVRNAFIFASAAHGAINQRRKFSGEPYIVHPVEVCALVSSVENHTTEMLAAALLHDVVEDTEITLDLIQTIFGNVVMVHVEGLTDISQKKHGNRAHRKAIDRAHTHLAGRQTQTIKVADLIANTRDIVNQDPKFAVVYMAEKRLLLEGMDADPTLLKAAWKLVTDFEDGVAIAPHE